MISEAQKNKLIKCINGISDGTTLNKIKVFSMEPYVFLKKDESYIKLFDDLMGAVDDEDRNKVRQLFQSFSAEYREDLLEDVIHEFCCTCDFVLDLAKA